MNIPELKKAMEVVRAWMVNLPTERDSECFNSLLSTCQLLCDVSDKMEPKKGKFMCDCEKDCHCFDKINGYNLARSEDILWFTKKMMGMENIVSDIVFENCQLTYADAGKKIANSIRQEILGGGR